MIACDLLLQPDNMACKPCKYNFLLSLQVLPHYDVGTWGCLLGPSSSQSGSLEVWISLSTAQTCRCPLTMRHITSASAASTFTTSSSTKAPSGGERASRWAAVRNTRVSKWRPVAGVGVKLPGSVGIRDCLLLGPSLADFPLPLVSPTLTVLGWQRTKGSKA